MTLPIQPHTPTDGHKTANNTAPTTGSVSAKQRHRNLLPLDGFTWLSENFLDQNQAEYFWFELIGKTLWQSGTIKLFGKEFLQPRLYAWYGDSNSIYTYSNLTLTPNPWSPALLELKKLTEAATGHTYNSALLNLYRDEQDSMGAHRDNEKELGPEPVIASVSLGASRRFRLQHTMHKKQAIELTLNHGSLLLMQGQTQRFWKHSVPKERYECGPRINITFRTIFT